APPRSSSRIRSSRRRISAGPEPTVTCGVSRKLALAPLAGLAITVVVAFALPGHAHGKGHGHGGGGHGAHHSAHRGGSSGLWRQSPGSASPGTGNTATGRPGGVGRPGHPTSSPPTMVLPSPTGS